MEKKEGFSRRILILVLISAFVRFVLAALLEMGNDEVYYWTYAVFPDWSHFDHPPMVGWFIQIFTLDLLLDSELALRMTSIIIGSLNTYLIYLLGRMIRDEATGWYAALLYTASIYCFLITGTFILPDTPQSLFWIMSLYFLMTAFNSPQAGRSQMLFAGISIGLAMLSKYTSVFLWGGAALYILLYDRKWLRSAWLYISMLVTAALFMPVIVWNIDSDFISFTYQGERVGFFGSGLRPDYFLQELSGQFFYNNPVNVVIIVMALVASFRKKITIEKQQSRIILLTSLPLILTFLFISLFSTTLPHWTGPAYYGLILLSAAYLRERQFKKLKIIPASLIVSLSILTLVIVVGFLQINFGLFYTGKEKSVQKFGQQDLSLDIYGWKQVGEAFGEIRHRDLSNGLMEVDDPVISYRWFPAAHLDYYVARPAGIHVLAIGSLERIHKYAWINQQRGGFIPGMNAYFITTSRDYADPFELYDNYFETIVPADTIPIYRNRKTAGYAFVFRMYGLKKMPDPF